MNPIIEGIEESELRYLYIMKSMSQREIAKYYGVSLCVIQNRMKEYRIESRTMCESLKKDFGITKEDLECKYNKEGMGILDIALYYNVSQTTIWNRMEEYDIERRTITEANTIYETPEERKKAQRESFIKFRKTEKSREWLEIYSKSNVRKESMKKYQYKRRGLSNISLNEPFDGSEFHHYNKEYGIHMPAEIHQSIRHNIWSGKNMDLINKEAFEFLEWEMMEKQWDDITGDWMVGEY